MKEIFLRLSSRFLKEGGALLVWAKTKKELERMGFKNLAWPISFVKGNLTVGVYDSFVIAQLKAKEKNWVRRLNGALPGVQIKKVFYRFSSPHGYGPTSKES